MEGNGNIPLIPFVREGVQGGDRVDCNRWPGTTGCFHRQGARGCALAQNCHTHHPHRAQAPSYDRVVRFEGDVAAVFTAPVSADPQRFTVTLDSGKHWFGNFEIELTRMLHLCYLPTLRAFMRVVDRERTEFIDALQHANERRWKMRFPVVDLCDRRTGVLVRHNELFVRAIGGEQENLR